jgi:hypothetical protein
MTRDDRATPRAAADDRNKTNRAGDWSTVGTVLGALGAIAAVWAYWLVLPGIILGISAIALGVLGRRRDPSDAGSLAIALGVVAVLLVPSVLLIVDDAEEWGRNCALNPADPNC